MKTRERKITEDRDRVSVSMLLERNNAEAQQLSCKCVCFGVWRVCFTAGICADSVSCEVVNRSLCPLCRDKTV